MVEQTSGSTFHRAEHQHRWTALVVQSIDGGSWVDPLRPGGHRPAKWMWIHHDSPTIADVMVLSSRVTSHPAVQRSSCSKSAQLFCSPLESGNVDETVVPHGCDVHGECIAGQVPLCILFQQHKP